MTVVQRVNAAVGHASSIGKAEMYIYSMASDLSANYYGFLRPAFWRARALKQRRFTKTCFLCAFVYEPAFGKFALFRAFIYDY